MEFPGLVNDVADYYARADVYVQASRREAMPMSVLEAMAAGLPIIATDVGGVKDVVKGNGYLYMVDDDNELLMLMKQFSTMKEEKLHEMVDEAKGLVVAFSSRTMAEKYCVLYEGKGNR